MQTMQSENGAVRSDDGQDLDFTSLPIIGLIAVARTAHEGGTKYGRWNYLLGFSAWQLINRALRHIFLFLASGNVVDLAHATWGLMAAIQELTLNPERNRKDLLGPGMSFPLEMKAAMDNAAPRLGEFRKSEVAQALDQWDLFELPEVKSILAARITPRRGQELGSEKVPYINIRS